jgi:rhodanese-related sulfurtransferase
MQDKSCKTPRWRLLKAQLNNLPPKSFADQIALSSASLIIDVRTSAEFEQGHIKNAINISYLDDDFWDRMEQLDTSKEIFVYCRTGRRSIRACTLMRNGGFDSEKIFNLDGGYALWLEEH